ncbi:MAG: thiamine phosphate synthase [Gallionella sp.]|nr:thiamine phosphate synthase [Gallionella sp.]
MKKIPRSSISGLYVVTPDERDTAELLRRVRLALQGGAQFVQYRNKLADAELRLDQAGELRGLTREFAATFVVNDDARLAARVDADGVHLGRGDGSVVATRALLGANKLIGVSCYNQLDLARQAKREGADYLAFGAFFASAVKPNAPVASLELLREARLQLSLPIVAIGGITLDNSASVLAAGASALAVISAVFSADDIEQTARQFSALADK